MTTTLNDFAPASASKSGRLFSPLLTGKRAAPEPTFTVASGSFSVGVSRTLVTLLATEAV